MFLCQAQLCLIKIEKIYMKEYFHQVKVRDLFCFRIDYPDQEFLNCVVCMFNNGLTLGIVGVTCSVYILQRFHEVIKLL